MRHVGPVDSGNRDRALSAQLEELGNVVRKREDQDWENVDESVVVLET